MSSKSLLATLLCVVLMSIRAAAMGNGTPMGAHAGSVGGPPASVPGMGSAHPGWRGGTQHFDHSEWRAGHWWHGVRGRRIGWWWNVGPSWYWYPAAIYPYPDAFTPPYLINGFWYWCDFYQNYYPNVATCPSEWEAIEPQ